MAAVFAATVLSLAPSVHGADQVQIVFKGGRTLPLDAVTVENGQFKVLSALNGFAQGQAFRLDLADYVSGEKPEAVNRGVALVLLEKPVEAISQLEPVLAAHKATASVQGNYWVEAARATLFAYAMIGNTAKMDALGREISAATRGAGTDPSVTLAKALALPPSKADEKAVMLKDLLSDDQPIEIAAYAGYFRAQTLQRLKRGPEALEAYLSVPCLLPTGSSVVNGAAELAASQFLADQSRREEALALLNAAVRDAKGTEVAAEANKRLESLK